MSIHFASTIFYFFFLLVFHCCWCGPLLHLYRFTSFFKYIFFFSFSHFHLFLCMYFFIPLKLLALLSSSSSFFQFKIKLLPLNNNINNIVFACTIPTSLRTQSTFDGYVLLWCIGLKNVLSGVGVLKRSQI